MLQRICKIFRQLTFLQIGAFLCSQSFSNQEKPKPSVSEFPSLFPEELAVNKKKWDVFCQTYKRIELNNSPPIRSHMEFKSFKSEGFLRGLGVARFLPRAQANPEKGFLEISELILDYLNYPAWLMPGINQKEPPDEGNYFVSLEGLNVKLNPVNKTEAKFSGPYSFSLLGFSRKGHTSVYTRQIEFQMPLCLKNKNEENAQGLRLFFRMTPRVEILKLLAGEILIIERKNQNKNWTEMYIHVVSELSPIVYNLLPETMVDREIKSRAQKVFFNLLERRSLVFSP
jgi:hypothetical protein